MFSLGLRLTDLGLAFCSLGQPWREALPREVVCGVTLPVWKRHSDSKGRGRWRKRQCRRKSSQDRSALEAA